MNDEGVKYKNYPSDLRLEYTRVKMMYEQLGEGVIPYYAWLLTLLCILIISDASVVGIVVWVLIIVVIEVNEIRLRDKFFTLEQVNNPLLWEWYMVISICCSALTISIGMMLMLDLHDQVLMYTCFALITITALVSGALLVTSMRAQYVWILGLTLPLVLKAVASDDIAYWIFGGAVFFGGLPTAIILGKKLHEDFVETLKLRFENSELLATAQAERAKAEEERRRAEKASADKMRFLASASHDLRQPIHALELFSDALEHELDSPAQFELMGKMKESTAAMNGLLYSLLDISKLDAGVIKVNKSMLLLTDLLEKIIQAIQQQAKDKGIKIVFKAKPCAVVSDAVLLESILHNLLNNAVKYTHEGRVEISCDTSKNGKVIVSIMDTGMGISDENKAIVFDEFIQLDNPQRDRTQGLGLGLAIVKRTCALLDHQLTFQSEVNVGSVFSLALEAANIADIEVQKQSQVVGGKIQATVLVIDDERIILDGMEKMLSRWGCTVFTAVSLAEALQLLQDNQAQAAGMIDLIIADYRLAEGKLGTDAVSKIKQVLNTPNMPAMIITGDTGTEQLQDIEGAGYHVLHKPVAPMRVRALMQNLLNLSNPHGS